MEVRSGGAARLQVFDGVLRPPVLDEQVQGMTGEKRVVRVRVANIRVLLQAKLQRTTLVPEAIGEGFAKRPAKKWQGIGWGRCQCARASYLGKQRHPPAP